MLNVFYIFLALGIYIWSVFGLRKTLLKNRKIYTYQEFKINFPQGKLVAWLHSILSPLVFVVILAAGAIISVRFSDGTLEIATGMLLAVSGLILFNGIFELITGICPIYGALIKRHRNQCFITGKGVEILGFVHLLVGILLLGGTIYFRGIEIF